MRSTMLRAGVPRGEFADPPPVGLVQSRLLLVGGLQREADRVYAVPVAGRGPVAVGEHVTEVRAAVGAADLDPLHAVRGVLDVLDRVGDRLVERGPAAAGGELDRKSVG